jgi:hypothetical protein
MAGRDAPPMTESCPNCGKPVLPTDTACWHCDYALPQRARAKARPPMPARVGPLVREQPTGDASDYDLRALLVYGLLTLALILCLGLVMRALGRQPVLVRSVALAGGDWVTVTDIDLHYTLSLPADWQWLDVAYRDQTELLPTIIERQPAIGQALAPLGAPAGDVAILAVALGAQDLTAADPIPFAVVGRSRRLRALAPQAALDLLDGQELSLTEAAVATHLAGQPQARFKVFDPVTAYQCRHLFVADGTAYGYLVAACAPQAGYGTRQQQLDDLLDTFQLLVN